MSQKTIYWCDSNSDSWPTVKNALKWNLCIYLTSLLHNNTQLVTCKLMIRFIILYMCIIVMDPELIVKRGERLHASTRHHLPGTKPWWCVIFTDTYLLLNIAQFLCKNLFIINFCGGNAIPKCTSIAYNITCWFISFQVVVFSGKPEKFFQKVIGLESSKVFSQQAIYCNATWY